MKVKALITAYAFLLLSLFACTPGTEPGSGSETVTPVPLTVPPTETAPVPPTDAPTVTAPPPTEMPPALTDENLANMTYSGIFDESVTLVDGMYEGEPPVEGSAMRPTVRLFPLSAFGDLDGDGVTDAAALLVQSSGGSGSFYFLAAVLNRNGEPENVATIIIDDRAGPEALTIADGQIVFDRKVRAESDPFCCPSLGARVVYALEGDELAEISFELTTVNISGQVALPNQLEPVGLPPDSRVIVRVEDTSLADAPADILGEQIVENAQSLPLSYQIVLHPTVLEMAAQVTVSARVEGPDGALLYISDTANLVTLNDPTVNVEVIPVGIEDGGA